jgi:hypothetical protein
MSRLYVNLKTNEVSLRAECRIIASKSKPDARRISARHEDSSRHQHMIPSGFRAQNDSPGRRLTTNANES